MKLKKLSALCLAVVLLATCCLPVLAAESAAREWKGDDFTFVLPAAIRYDMGTAEAGDPTWGMVGVTDGEDQVEENEEFAVIADLYTENGEINIKVMSRLNDATMELFDLSQMSQEELDALLPQLLQSETDGITVQRRYLEIDGQPFYYLRADGATEQYGEAHEITIGTIFNGHTLNFNIHSTAEFQDFPVSMLEEMVDSVRITARYTLEQVEEMNRPDPIELREYIPIFIVLGFVLLMVLAPAVVIPVRRKLNKKSRDKMAARLTAYEKEHRDNRDWDPGELRFANATECTREAIHKFSMYQALVKSWASLALGAAVCAAVLITVFVFNMVWWMKVIAVGVTVFFAYRACTIPGAVEKVQLRLHNTSNSNVAQYMFYDEAFRVSGIQPSTLYPYFRITAVRRSGQYVYLYYGPENAHILDQYGFSVGDMDSFLAFIKEKMQEEKSK